MLKKLLRAIRTVEAFETERQEISRRLDLVESVLESHRSQVNAVEGGLGALDAQVTREVLNMAELYGKTYRLLKRMQAEDRHDAEDVPEPDIAPVVDAVTERVMARRHHVSPRNTSS